MSAQNDNKDPYQFRNPSDYRIEWKNSEGERGYFERKGEIFDSYEYDPSEDYGTLYRINDKNKTLTRKYDIDSHWWAGDDTMEGDSSFQEVACDDYNDTVESRAEYAEEYKARLDFLYDDDLEDVAFFPEKFLFAYNTTADFRSKWLPKDLVGKAVICGVECLVYDNHKRNSTHYKVWIDPANGLCLRWEDVEDGEWFEVTAYRINSYK